MKGTNSKKIRFSKLTLSFLQSIKRFRLHLIQRRARTVGQGRVVRIVSKVLLNQMRVSLLCVKLFSY
jgi:hypothetical protein